MAAWTAQTQGTLDMSSFCLCYKQVFRGKKGDKEWAVQGGLLGVVVGFSNHVD